MMVSSIPTLFVYLLGWLLSFLGEATLLLLLRRQHGKLREALMYTAGIGLVVLWSVL
ncbi:hypothetical protein HN020_06955 [Brevibacillus borstelensis]|uniref:hypothetical protein n=1 Tax=Brevibacillus borstelensis TaxID=45462 RepID=UPI0012DE579D|nr:hypothetical protein [Brevibacillus borstelensis]MBE5393939.1 hypothetical protein [Brevibacillus borstelensis]MCM3473113.1 hypothetical protein [Brevibacillus borstelensis]MCM3561187.1 hypothetical protein [Brevibacillus borstelensis]MED1743642.1 hypothetical protein [Brevibacillus borstelensis]MED1852238.1 hypothetical protein [Brevibacillus borstelensis]